MQLENDDLLYEEKLQRREECLGAKHSNSTDSFVLKFQKELRAYEEMYVSNRVDSRTSVLDFWEEKMTTFPLLYELSSIVLAAPGTQVSVERLFSALKLIYLICTKDSDHRMLKIFCLFEIILNFWMINFLQKRHYT